MNAVLRTALGFRVEGLGFRVRVYKGLRMAALEIEDKGVAEGKCWRCVILR